ncbi:hypothetical protein [Klebsiella pneumoniae]|uniref:hypothetical protein n=1 Tax=Klebsiella pneumoniae TaxID=573 RepID=UPI00103A4090|nr:hypothetical protein [Klebsiella pneumoniae]RZG36998.1 hypothetical protein EXT45_11025 [Klebsiella pneumoniae]
MKTYYKVTGKTCHTIHAELRKIGDLINPIPNKKYHIPKLMTKATRLLLIKSISERIKNNR